MSELGFLIFLIVAIASLVAGLIFLLFRIIRGYRKGEVPTPVLVSIGVFVSGFCIFFPIYWGQFDGDYVRIIKAILLSIHNTIRLFIVDCDFEIIFGGTEPITNAFVKSLYHGTAAVTFVSAPIMTFTFVLSLFKDLIFKMKFKSPFRKKYYIFNQLNEKSIVLAEDIRKKLGHKATIVFTDVRDENDDELNDVVERAKIIYALLFKKDVTSLKLPKNNGKEYCVFFMGNDDDNNIEAYNSLYKDYRDHDNLELYLFSQSTSSALTFNRPLDLDDKEKPRKVYSFRIDTDSFLVSNYLWNYGQEIFQNAYVDPKTKKKTISIVIVGLGRYGKILLKNLVWYCQMPGYYLKINVLDGSEDASERFALECPELMDKKHNKKKIKGDAQYDITIHDGVYTGTNEYTKIIKSIKDVSYIFVSLGTDELNLSTCLDLRTLMEDLGRKPLIKTYRPDCDKETTFETATNYKGQRYNITFIGDYRSSYSYDTVINNAFEQAGLETNRGYNAGYCTPEEADKSFWFYEYNYSSSCATAIHNKAKEDVGINLNRAPSELTEKEKYDLMELEHKRWNAYMRSQGYVWGGGYTKAFRNDLAKKHHNLVPFDKLSDDDKYKDIKVILKKQDPVSESKEEEKK